MAVERALKTGMLVNFGARWREPGNTAETISGFQDQQQRGFEAALRSRPASASYVCAISR
jgi:hypothetical protein